MRQIVYDQNGIRIIRYSDGKFGIIIEDELDGQCSTVTLSPNEFRKLARRLDGVKL